MSTKRAQGAWIRAIGVVVGVVCYLLLPDRLPPDWHGGLSVLACLAIVAALAWRLKMTAAELWWWPLNAPKPSGDGDEL